MKRLAAVLLLLATLGCDDVQPCRDNTLLVTITLDDATLAADGFDVVIDAGGRITPAQAITHTRGEASGNLEVGFPSGYVPGELVTITVTARANGQPIESVTATTTLAPTCTTLMLRFGSTGADAAID
jgi:hypothetical protein